MSRVHGGIVIALSELVHSRIFLLALLVLVALPNRSAHAGQAEDLLGHDTDSMYFGAGGGDKGADVSLLLRIYGVEAGVAAQESGARSLEGVDQLPTEDPLATSTSFFVGISPVTFGSWHGAKKKASDDSFSSPEIAYAQPYLHYKRTKVKTGDESFADESMVFGTRAFLGGGIPFRMGLYAQAEVWGPEQGSVVSGGVLLGTGSYDDHRFKKRTMPSPVRTVVSFAVLTLASTAIGLVFGFMDKECSEEGKSC
jgi:hypothetical protein